MKYSKTAEQALLTAYEVVCARRMSIQGTCTWEELEELDRQSDVAYLAWYDSCEYKPTPNVAFIEQLRAEGRQLKDVPGIPMLTVDLPSGPDCFVDGGHRPRLHAISVTIPWVCRVCGGPRNAPWRDWSYDGSHKILVHGWDSPCGHVELYPDVLAAAQLARAFTAEVGVDAEGVFHFTVEQALEPVEDGFSQIICTCSSEEDATRISALLNAHGLTV
jgi:hypothetical protein